MGAKIGSTDGVGKRRYRAQATLTQENQ